MFWNVGRWAKWLHISYFVALLLVFLGWFLSVADEGLAAELHVMAQPKPGVYARYMGRIRGQDFVIMSQFDKRGYEYVVVKLGERTLAEGQGNSWPYPRGILAAPDTGLFSGAPSVEPPQDTTWVPPAPPKDDGGD